MRSSKWIIAGIAAVVTACTFTPKDVGRAYMFALDPVSTVSKNTPVDDSLTVLLPKTAPEVDTYRIALTQSGGRWDYYAGARWSEFLPVLVQNAMVETLEDARLFKTVSSDDANFRGEDVLKTEIRNFHAEYQPGKSAPTAKIRMVVSLRKRLEGTTLLSFELKSAVAAEKDSLPEIQTAFSKAFADIQKQLVFKLGGPAVKPAQ